MNSSSSFFPRVRALRSPILLLSATAFAGCAVLTPRPLANADALAAGKASIEQARSVAEPLLHPLSLEEAMARAIKYNLNERARRMEQAIALNVWTAGRYDMLPHVLGSAGYHSRDSDLITRSKDSVTGRPSLANPYISSDREYALYDLGVSWSLLDFSLGYYNARQNSDRVLIAAEQRRKAMHLLCRDVAVAFYRMASAQKLLGDVRNTLQSAEAALADAEKANAEGLRSPLENLRYQRQMLENVRLLSTLEKDFASARVTLASLINAPQTTTFSVVEPPESAGVGILGVPVEQMEEVALSRNADLKEQLYNERIARVEVRKALAKLVPNLGLNFDGRSSTDSYLINHDWTEAGVLLSQNLTGLLAAPAQRRVAKAGVELAADRRLAQAMALVAQVHIARLELESSYRQLGLADRIWKIDQQIKEHTSNRADAQTESKLSQVATDTASIVSLLRRYQALADFNAATSTLQATLGLEIDLGSVDALSLDQLTDRIRSSQEAWRSGRLSAVASEPAARAAASGLSQNG